MQFSRGDKGFQQNGSGFSRQLAAIMAECLSFFINFGVVTDQCLAMDAVSWFFKFLSDS